MVSYCFINISNKIHIKLGSERMAPLQYEGKLHTDTIIKANILNKQFQSVFSAGNPMTTDGLPAHTGNITQLPEIDIFTIMGY